MKTIGGHQLLSMTFPRLPVSERWYGILGRLPEFFYGIVYGNSGEGKTEFCVQLAIELSRFGKVEWVSYEQGHGPDLQDAAARNNVQNYPISFSNPWVSTKRKANKVVLNYPRCKNERINQLFEELIMKIAAKKSAKFWFIDSADTCKFTKEMCEYLRTTVGARKGILFIGHGKGGEPKSGLGQDIEFNGSIGFYVEHFIAYPNKSRWQGNKPLVIVEHLARERNPLFFEFANKPAKVTAKKKEKPARKPRVKKIVEPEKIEA